MIEADLQRFYQVDLADVWRGRVSWRRLKNLVDYLPPDAMLYVVARKSEVYWPIEAYLLDDIRMALTGSKEKPAKPHPARPKSAAKTFTPQRREALLAAQARRRARQQMFGK